MKWGILVLFLAVNSHAALTASQLREHFGAMMNRGMTNYIRNGETVDEVTFRDIVSWAKDYRVNGTLGTQADRTEAVRTFYRMLFQKLTGIDPANATASQIHYYKTHWLADFIGKEDADAIEP